MTVAFAVTIFAIGFIGSFVSGMLGIGGSIIKYPLLLYMPVLLGVGAFTVHEVAAISAVQVAFAAIAGAFVFMRSGFLHLRLAAVMGAGILVGSFLGAWTSSDLAPATINATYAILATIAAALMLTPTKRADDGHDADVDLRFNAYAAAGLAAAIGVASGIVGAAGAFLLVPVMIVVLGIPTRITIATSLAITFVAALGSAGGKLLTGQVPLTPAVVMIVACLLGSPIGARISTKVDTRVLRMALAMLIGATAVRIWMSVLLPGSGA